ncbi:MAG: hypothetical protein JNK15_24070 [Planctomycetes bacterium]|nr:hypothetical protein [Planctomycetota bacterium]
MNTASSTVRSLLRLALLGGAALGSVLAQDVRATHEPMFGATGSFPGTGTVRLDGGLPPVLGTTTTWSLSAPGFSFAITGIGTNVWPAWHPFGDPLVLYLDPLALLGTMSLPLSGPGFGTMPLPLPPDPTLNGLDLALQAIVLAPTGHVASSNLVVSNVGGAPGAGQAVFAFQFGPVSIPPATTWPSNQGPAPVVENTTQANKDYTITGTRAQGGGQLVIKDQNGTVRATIPANQTTFGVTVTVPPGTKLFLANSDPNQTVNGVSWSIQVG